ncbi:unnamed protein product [Protopolystoma xenopodis]|uniref:Folate receptor-like domain-containing protein n=1 Tax=Protopolystoma xenopodis TaxID=117903 RepID=A0A3S5AUR7_9PLAT|nr:unnamed protein product [Protopolystoma xenopodis]
MHDQGLTSKDIHLIESVPQVSVEAIIPPFSIPKAEGAGEGPGGSTSESSPSDSRPGESKQSSEAAQRGGGLVRLPLEEEYCSFFNNRAPRAQETLSNCTWYRERSCCQDVELKITFAKMKPLKGASDECVRYLNYLMCYICAPDQYNFYLQDRLTVSLGRVHHHI